MKYINYKLILILLVTGASITSCESFLEEENNSSLSVDNIKTDPTIFGQLVASAYERSRETTTYYESNMYYSLEDIGTDIVTRGTAITGTNDLNDYVNLTPLNNVVRVYWKNQYSIIAAANLVTEQELEDIEGLSDTDKNRGIAEAKFFRAWAYFKLVENYGGVPLILERAITATRDYTRATEEQVYTQIVQDLQDALAGVLETPTVFGRVSKDAVRHLTSKVLLTRGYKSFAAANDFTDAATLAETVIANHNLVPSFASLVSITNQRNSEVVFSYLFGSNSVSRGWGNSRHMLYQFRFFDYPGLTRTLKGLDPMPTPFYYSLYEDNDTRAEATFSREILATVDYVGKNGANVSAGERAIYFPKVAWTPAEIAAVPYVVFNPGTYFTNDGTTPVHYPQFIKFADPSIPFTQPDQPSVGERDMVMMRAGEAYLIAAEAYFKSNNSIDAAARLTTLRSRAGLITPVLPAEVNLDFILDERARELAGEVNRWMDLKRTGKLIERVLLHNPHAELNDALQAKHLLRPIPQTEIDNTGGSITQNPNYNN
ncbi:RagB/SusD family nutrient uptake outer membrane protein [Mariniflexile litorale]|uniref:RagB/SusD family nutrient uptake outer membrane protein n=1 Tax=Mariniflexile litorale TaxID=3045158 RepID=A0AAU7EIK5_9FLAO|nr:RagB/SusD family nutrient uptake outer membrane protein [Mariniflexile sp. KMM 9835]MDQ8210871.1 RagB/SusD family nutrient uptake outer membrane protein [Mariniflexile sp. KMM 9835]